MKRVWVAPAVGALMLAGCSSVHGLDFPTPPAGASGPTTTVVGPLFGSATADEGAVAGATTTTTVALRPGTSSLIGTVSGPAAPVAGATVEIDRLVGDQVASTQVTSTAGGAWSISGVLGGRYRVRAWRGPGLAMTTPRFVFVGAGATASLSLRMARFGTLTATASSTPYPAVEGQPTAISVEVSLAGVSATGQVTYTPQPAVPVTLVPGGWSALGSGTATTGTDGVAGFVAVCSGVGPVPLQVDLGGTTTVSLPTPTCAAPPATTTTTSPSSTVSVPSGSTTTTTTTTTVPVPTS